MSPYLGKVLLRFLHDSCSEVHTRIVGVHVEYGYSLRECSDSDYTHTNRAGNCIESETNSSCDAIFAVDFAWDVLLGNRNTLDMTKNHIDFVDLE